MKQKKDRRKIAIVMSGGGMKCAYGAGVLDALATHYGFTKPDLIVAASGSAGNAVYYLAHEMNKTFLVWIAIAKDKKIFSIVNRPHFDIHYLVNTLFKKKFPFAERVFKRSKTKLYFPATRLSDGKLVFLHPHQGEKIYPFLKAATAMPFAFGKSVRVRRERYIDGDFGSNIEDLVHKAVDEGARTIIVIDNDRTKDSYVRLLMRAYASLPEKYTSHGLRIALRRELGTGKIFVPPRSVELISVVPSQKLGVSTMERSPAKIRRVINLGYDDAVNHPKLEEFLGAP